MSDIFTVVLDLSLVKNDKEKNKLYIALADRTHMRMIYEFKLWIKFLYSLECSIELYHEDAILHDLDDIRVLSLLKIVQVRPLGSVEEEKCYEKELISKLNEYNEKYGNMDPRPMPNDVCSNFSFFESYETVCDVAPLQLGKSVKTQEVSKLDTSQKVETSSSAFLRVNDQSHDVLEKPKTNFVRDFCDEQESKTFRLENKSGMAKNLKLGTFLQQRYYGWYAKSDKNSGYTKYLCNKTGEATKEDLKSGEQYCSDYAPGGGVVKNEHISNDLKQKCMRISDKSICKGTSLSLIQPKINKDHEFCDIKPLYKVKSESLTNASRFDYGAGGSDHVFGTVQKPFTSLTTNAAKKDSTPVLKSGNKPMSFDEILKMLREAAVSRAKNLPGNSSGPQNKVNKSKIDEKGKLSKTKTTAVDGSLNIQQEIKHEITSNNPGMLDKSEKVKSFHQTCNTEATNSLLSCNLIKKKARSKVKIKAGSKNKTQSSQNNTLLKGCKKTENTGKLELKSEAPGSLHQCNLTKKKKKPKTKNETECNALSKGSEKLDKNDVQKSESMGKLELKSEAPGSLHQCNLTKKKKKRKAKNKTESENKTQSGQSNPAIPLTGCQNICSNPTDKIRTAGKMKVETSISKPIEYHNAQSKKILLNDNFRRCTSDSTFKKEFIYPYPLLNMKNLETAKDSTQNAPTSGCVSETIIQLECQSVFNPNIRESNETAKVEFPVGDTSGLRNFENVALPTKRENLESNDDAGEKTKDENGINRETYSDAFFPFGEQGKTRNDDVNSFINTNNCSSCFVTNEIIAHPCKIIDYDVIEEAKDVNFDNRKEFPLLEGDANLESNDFACDNVQEISAPPFSDGFKSGDPGALSLGEEKEKSVQDCVGEGDTNLPEFCGILKNEVIPLPYASIESMKTEKQEGLPLTHEYEIGGSVNELASSRAESFDARNNFQPENDFGSDAINNKKYIIEYIKNVFIKYQIFSNLLKAFLIISVIIIMYLDFRKLF